MSWNMPEGISENDIPENEELAPNQIEEIEYIEKSIEKFKAFEKELQANCPVGIKDIMEVIGDVMYCDYKPEDYISEPITEDREPNEGEE